MGRPLGTFPCDAAHIILTGKYNRKAPRSIILISTGLAAFKTLNVKASNIKCVFLTVANTTQSLF